MNHKLIAIDQELTMKLHNPNPNEPTNLQMLVAEIKKSLQALITVAIFKFLFVLSLHHIHDLKHLLNILVQVAIRS